MAESPSGLFPDYRLAWAQPIAGLDDFLTEILTARSGREQRRRARDARRRWAAETTMLSAADRKILRDFLTSHSGRYQAFYFWNPIPENLAAYACGSVAASATFTVPVKGVWWRGETAVAATYSAVYVGGVSKDFTVTPNIGANGEDRITFTAGAQTGAVTVDATEARVRVTSRYDLDSIRAMFPPTGGALASFPVVVQELI